MRPKGARIDQLSWQSLGTQATLGGGEGDMQVKPCFVRGVIACAFSSPASEQTEKQVQYLGLCS